MHLTSSVVFLLVVDNHIKARTNVFSVEPLLGSACLYYNPAVCVCFLLFLRKSRLNNSIGINCDYRTAVYTLFSNRPLALFRLLIFALIANILLSLVLYFKLLSYLPMFLTIYFQKQCFYAKSRTFGFTFVVYLFRGMKYTLN